MDALPDSPAESRLQELERRWHHDRSPRVFLQFADELRRAGRTTRAIEILTEGLELHPDSVSGMVALGRTLLEADEPGHARTFLERAIERDPSQYVASRLLVECFLRLGDGAAARERLEVCRLLNDRDPELDSLAASIEALESGQGAAATGAPDQEPTLAIFDLPEPERLPTLELVRGAADGRTARLADATRRAAPFGDLADGADASRRILSHIRAEGIFTYADAPAEAAPASAPVSEPVPEEPDLRPEAPAPVSAEPMFSLQSIGAEVEREGESPAGAEPGAAAASGDDGLDELPEIEPRTAPSTTDAAAAETATLGNLYLAQGHLDEAERAFRAALDRRSDDPVARRGLEEIERRRAVASVAPFVAVEGGGPTQRRIALLRGWMTRLRTERLARSAGVS